MHLRRGEFQQRRRRTSKAERFARVLIAAGALMIACLAAGPSQRVNSSLQGSYKITFAGALTGKGNAAVAAKSLTITGTVRDESGNTSHFHAAHLTLSENGFSGTATAFGATVQIWG